MTNFEFFKTSSGIPVSKIPVEAFPGLLTFSYLVVLQDYIVLIDSGSGIGSAGDQLLDGIVEAGKISTEKSFSLKDITHILITHGHIDHFGGIKDVCARTDALIGVHELDRRNITNFRERRTVNLHNLADYLLKAGVEQDRRESMLEFYRYTFQLFDYHEVDFGYEEIKMQLGPFRFLHVPGHSGGHVVIRLDNILFCGDHVLSDITPHQAPEELSPWCGLNHYLRSLDMLDAWAGEVQLSLCGHRDVIHELSVRISQIKQMHMERLESVLDFFQFPATIDSLSESLFGNMNGFDGLLAIEEAGAHVEYLYQRGRLKIENYNELKLGEWRVPLKYRTIP